MNENTDSTKPLPTPASLGVNPSRGLTQSEAAARLAKYGANALDEKKQSALMLFLSYFWGPIPWMIEAAALMSLLVKDWGDFSIILGLLVFNALLGFMQEHRASNALEALKNSLALKARVLRDSVWNDIEARLLVPGDIIRIRIGDVVPADVLLLDGGFASIDQAALTGESLPVDKSPGDPAYSGSVVKKGDMTAMVSGTGGGTFFGRTAKLVSTAGTTSHFQQAVLRIGNFLIVLAVILAVILVVDQLVAMEGRFDRDKLLLLAQFVLILLVASVPVAMPAVLSMTMALGARMLARKKAIVSRLESIEELAGIDILCSDKTGTLTQNKLTLAQPTAWQNASPDDVVLAGALASKNDGSDPIDTAVVGGLPDARALEPFHQQAFVPFDPVSKRTEATIRDPAGKTFRVTKGMAPVVLDLCALSKDDRSKADSLVEALASKGMRALGVARSDDQSWRFLGILPLMDPPRTDARQTVSDAKTLGLTVKMVTGDDVAIAKTISAELGLGTNIQPASALFPGDVSKGEIPKGTVQKEEAADGFARVFPEHKYAIVKALQEGGHLTGMTGDGVNDAPALKQADVGVAVSGATDAARAAADLILTAPGLSVIIDGIREARRIFERMMSYTLYRIAMTIDIMVFVVLAVVFYDFFPLTPIMIIALALLDDVPIMTIAHDNVVTADKPVRWDMNRALLVSSVLGLLAVTQSFGLLFLGDSLYHLDRPHLQTMMFLQLVAGGHLMLLLTRTARPFFLPPFPSPPLLFAILGTQIVATLLCGFGAGHFIPPLPWPIIAAVWLYNLVWMVAQDFVKLGLYRVIDGWRVGRTTPFLARLKTPLQTHLSSPPNHS